MHIKQSPAHVISNAYKHIYVCMHTRPYKNSSSQPCQHKCMHACIIACILHKSKYTYLHIQTCCTVEYLAFHIASILQ